MVKQTRTSVDHPAITIYSSLLLGFGDDENHLRDQDGKEEGIGRENNSKNLPIHLVETHPATAGEGSQGVAHSDKALAAHNSGFKLPLEGAVEGNNSILIRGEQRSLYTNEKNVGGDDGQKLEENGDKTNDDGLPGVATVKLGWLVALGLAGEVDAECLADEARDNNGGRVGGPYGKNGEAGSLKGLLEWREALVELALARAGHNNMGPGHTQLGERELSKQSADRNQGQESLKDVAQGGLGKSKNSSTDNSTEVGAPASDRGEQAAGGTERCGDRLARDRRSWSLVSSTLIEGDGFVGGRVRVLDDSKSREDGAKRVSDLSERSATTFHDQQFSCAGLTKRNTGKKMMISTSPIRPAQGGILKFSGLPSNARLASAWPRFAWCEICMAGRYGNGAVETIKKQNS